MPKSFLHRLIAAALTVMLPGAVLSADAGTAMLTAGNEVLINGKQTMGRQAVLPGDSINNNGNVDAVLSLPGGTITMAKKSSVVYQSGEVRVINGAANVSATDVNAKYEEVSVRPSTKDARFVVGEINGKRVVAALHGSVLVSDGTNEVRLAEGTAMTQDRVPVPAATGKGVGKNTSKGSEEPRGGKRRAAAALPGWATVLLIGGAVGGVFGGLAAAGYFDSKKNVSNTTP